MPRRPTPAQSAASRRNGARSPGPKTPEGKAAVRLNALKHGLAAETVILPGEHMAGFDQLLQDLIDRIQPADNTELEFVRDWAQVRWRLQRCVLLERNALFYRMQLMEAELDRQWENPDRPPQLRRPRLRTHQRRRQKLQPLRNPSPPRPPRYPEGPRRVPQELPPARRPRRRRPRNTKKQKRTRDASNSPRITGSRTLGSPRAAPPFRPRTRHRGPNHPSRGIVTQ